MIIASIGTPFGVGMSRDISLAAVYPDIVTSSAGGNVANVNLDFDDTDMRISFVSKDVMVTNYTQMDGDFFELGSEVELPNIGQVFFYSFNNEISGQPSVPFDLPTTVSVINEAPANGVVFYTANYENQSIEKEVKLVATTENTIDFDLLHAPIITSPVPDEIFTLQEVDNMTVEWDNPNGPLTFNIVVIGSNHEVVGFDTGISGVDSVFWVNFLRPESTSMTIPTTDLPMFGANSDYFLYISNQHIDANKGFDELFVVDTTGNNQLDTAGSNFAAKALPFSTQTP
jgi:hypothetical protein